MSKTDKTMLDDAALEEVFAAGRSEAMVPSEGLMARILADAEAEIAARSVPVQPRKARRGLLRGFIDALGGWPAVAGMVTATVAGVWIGFMSPDELDSLSGGMLLSGDSVSVGYDLEDILPADGGLSALYEEGS